jgi:leukotriene-A4 hydrolase
LDWDTWFYKPGYPPKPAYDDSMVVQCYELAEKWKQHSSSSGSDFKPDPSDISSWSANQSVVFLERLQSFPNPPISVDDAALLGSTYGYATSENVELVSRFYGVGLMARAKSVYEPTADLLSRVGRMKFVRPLYRLLEECDRDYAIKVFEKNRDFYHPICRGMVERDLYGEKKKA